MTRCVALAALAVAFATSNGCGPLTRPLPQRLEDDEQKEVDDAWDQALTPVNKHDRQTWLDVMAGARAYEHGVDSLVLRSEKKWTGGRVVMEVHFDRARPDDDRFDLTVIDHAGKVLWHERFGRAEVEQAIRELFPTDLPPKGNVPDPPEVAARRAAHEARWKRIEAVIPNRDRGGQPKK
ncbi:MAG TPA: hypothetical protein VFG68_05240 [Fimbriiglobus sp.]|nr:hypothetical protein [Fimbriiglobus sp.]